MKRKHLGGTFTNHFARRGRIASTSQALIARRLDQLSLGGADKLQLEAKADIFFWRERLEYCVALIQMWRGLEIARVAPAKALRRIEGGAR
jgi:hypothetical protein